MSCCNSRIPRHVNINSFLNSGLSLLVWFAVFLEETFLGSAPFTWCYVMFLIRNGNGVCELNIEWYQLFGFLRIAKKSGIWIYLRDKGVHKLITHNMRHHFYIQLWFYCFLEELLAFSIAIFFVKLNKKLGFLIFLEKLERPRLEKHLCTQSLENLLSKCQKLLFLQKIRQLFISRNIF